MVHLLSLLRKPPSGEDRDSPAKHLAAEVRHIVRQLGPGRREVVGIDVVGFYGQDGAVGIVGQQGLGSNHPIGEEGIDAPRHPDIGCG